MNAEVASKSQQAYLWLREQIADRRFGPGYRLVFADIARDLDMSVVPVREAVRRLEAEGLVTFEHNVGARVTIVNEHEYVQAMESLGVIEAAATALALPHLTAADVDRAEHLNETLAMLSQHMDGTVFTEINHNFHLALYGPCPNTYLLEMVERAWTQLSGLRTSTFTLIPDRATRSVEEHREIIRLIRTGAPAQEVEDAVRRHVWRTLEAFLERNGRAHDSLAIPPTKKKEANND